jgi:hypothetical protein
VANGANPIDDDEAEVDVNMSINDINKSMTSQVSGLYDYVKFVRLDLKSQWVNYWWYCWMLVLAWWGVDGVILFWWLLSGKD